MNETSAKRIWEILESTYLTKSVENHLHLKRRLYRFQLKKRIHIVVHMNNYTKLLGDLANIDEMIKDENKVLILLSSLPDDEYETFVLTLINDKSSLSYDEESTSIVNHELRRKNKESSNSTSAEVLTVRGRSSNRKGKGDRGRSKSKAGRKIFQS